MKETWRNLSRRKLRTFLTVLGIVVGALALTVMGAMSEKLNTLVGGAIDYFNTRIIVDSRAAIPGQVFGPPISTKVVDEVKRVPGVDEAFAHVYLLYQEEDTDEMPSMGFGLVPLAIGVDANRFDYPGNRVPIKLSVGRFFDPGDRKAAIVGVDLAELRGVAVGDALPIKGESFDVVGIIERTLTVRDNAVFIPLRDAQEMLGESLPPPFNENPSTLASQVEVYPKDLDAANEVADQINARVPGVRAYPPGDLEGQIRQSLVVFNVIIVGGAVIAVVVGGLSILNTMVIAVTERTKEIGIKKAVGARNRDILWEFLREAALMGLVGGLAGLAVGAGLTVVINGFTAKQGVEIFAVTPRLAVLVIVFATVLGAVAGVIPAFRASRRNPVEALRAE